MPWHLVCKTRLETTMRAGHNGLLVATAMYSTGSTFGFQASHEIWKSAKSEDEYLLVVSVSVSRNSEDIRIVKL